MSNRLKFLRSTSASITPPPGTALDFGRIAVNIADRKIWMYGTTGTPSIVATHTTIHNPVSGYAAGDLVVQNNILYRCLANIGPKSFTPGDWQSVSDFRDSLIYRAPTTQAQAAVGLGAAGISFNITANGGQTAPIQQWRNGLGVTVSDIRSDGYPGAAFSRPVFRVDQIAHSFTGAGQPARFDGVNWVLADASTPAGFAVGLVRRVINANAFEIQTSGRIDGLQSAAFESGGFIANTRYYVSTTTPGKLTPTTPPDPASENIALFTLSDGSGIIHISTPISIGSGGGGGGTDTNIVSVTQPNSFTAVGQVAANTGTWVPADSTSVAFAPLGIIQAVAGNDFIVRLAGLVTGITADAADVFPLTAGTPYYVNDAGLLTATPPPGTPVSAAPVLWAVSGTAGIVTARPQNPNVLRPSQNLSDLTDVDEARANLGISGAGGFEAMPIGVPFGVWDHLDGVEAPINTGDEKFIILTAGFTDVDEYNEGLLTGETVSGSAPNITATAVIDFGPLAGQTIALINTEQAFIRPRTVSGELQDSQNKDHTHTGSTSSAGGHSHTGTTASAGSHSHTVPSSSTSTPRGTDTTILVKIPSGTTNTNTVANHVHTFSTNSTGSHSHSVSIGNEGGDEARPRSRSATFYLRIA